MRSFMSRIAIAITFWFCGWMTCQAAVVFEWATVGNPGNAPSITCIGAVNYIFQISKYEVTNAQYTEFLNAVDPAGSNTKSLYNLFMGSKIDGGIIYTSIGRNGAKYSTKENMANKPVNFVSFRDVMRFTNWLHNGQGTSDTENGAYPVDGPHPLWLRSTNATYFLPSENEWYKAAYYDPTKPGGPGYWRYPTRTDTAPTKAASDVFGNISNPGANVANYDSYVSWNGGAGVTTVGSAGPLSATYYGTYDQAGNVLEWNDTLISSGRWGIRSGSYNNPLQYLDSSFRVSNQYDDESANKGFRVATLFSGSDHGGGNGGGIRGEVPEPASMLIFGTGSLGLIFRNRRLRTTRKQ
ncbi:MAG: SUMF1/EgtB/PvdO family nonheme iron enzyme [Pirellula sp.]